MENTYNKMIAEKFVVILAKYSLKKRIAHCESNLLYCYSPHSVETLLGELDKYRGKTIPCAKDEFDVDSYITMTHLLDEIESNSNSFDIFHWELTPLEIYQLLKAISSYGYELIGDVPIHEEIYRKIVNGLTNSLVESILGTENYDL